MPDFRIFCPACGWKFVVSRDHSGVSAACPSCRRYAKVPSEAVPGKLLEMVVRFNCGACSNKLEIDASLAGCVLNCPECSKSTTVPDWPETHQDGDSVPVPRKLEETPRLPRVSRTLLSQGEVDFLTANRDDTAREPAGAVG